MAFCNACGQMLEAGTRFCGKCGAAQPGGSAPVAAATPTPAPAAPTFGAPPAAQPQSNNAVKIVLIVVGVVVLLGILGASTVAFIGWKIAHSVRVHEKNGNARVETPFGTVETNNNPSEVAHNLGVDIYPGARVVKSGAANIQMGGMHTIAADFETDDSPDKVADYYKSKFTNANVTTGDNNHYTIVSTDKNNLITIAIEPKDDKTVIHIANVSGKGVGGGSNN